MALFLAKITGTFCSVKCMDFWSQVLPKSVVMDQITPDSRQARQVDPIKKERGNTDGE
jgi:hypothetical protein